MHTLRDGTPIVIRDAQGDDVLAWHTFVATQQAATYGDSLSPDYVEKSLERFAEEADQRRALFEEPGTTLRRIALAGDRVIGVAQSGDGPAEWETNLGIEAIGVKRELNRLYLAEEAKGTGLAKTLLDMVTGSEQLYLWIINGNNRAHRFYLKHGFVDVDEQVTTGESWGYIPMHRMIRPEKS